MNGFRSLCVLGAVICFHETNILNGKIEKHTTTLNEIFM